MILLTKKLIWHGLISIHSLQNNYILDEGVVAFSKVLRRMTNLQYVVIPIPAKPHVKYVDKTFNHKHLYLSKIAHCYGTCQHSLLSLCKAL